jgi:hypothetical protein
LVGRNGLGHDEIFLDPKWINLYDPFSINSLFQWIKQHLRIKAFFGTTENAVKTRIWIAVSVYVLVAIVKKRLQLSAST